MRRLVFILCLWLTSVANADNVFLFRYLEQEIGEIPPYSQGAKDCTSNAAAMAVDILAAVQIHMHGRPELFVGRASPEAIHWGARELGNRGKASGVKAVSAAKFLRDFGVLFQRPYEADGHSIDLTGYSSDRARLYEVDGFPDWLEPAARQYRVRDIRQMRNGQDVVTEIKAGRPVLMASTYAFSRKRDKDGFVKPYLTQTISGPFGLVSRSSRRKWKHCMVATGYIDGDRPGIVIQNSHGNKQHGPNPLDIPEGAFAVDLKYIDRMVKDWFDCWSIGELTAEQQPTQGAKQSPPKGWIVVLSTDNCPYCEKQLEQFTETIRTFYRIAKVKAPKRLMDKWGYKVYPTTVIVDAGRRIKTFHGLTKWSQIEPYARKAKL